jgi:hypothetical protein
MLKMKVKKSFHAQIPDLNYEAWISTITKCFIYPVGHLTTPS